MLSRGIRKPGDCLRGGIQEYREGDGVKTNSSDSPVNEFRNLKQDSQIKLRFDASEHRDEELEDE